MGDGRSPRADRPRSGLVPPPQPAPPGHRQASYPWCRCRWR